MSEEPELRGAEPDLTPEPEEEFAEELLQPAVEVYDSFDDAPLDEPPEDGDNAILSLNEMYDPTSPFVPAVVSGAVLAAPRSAVAPFVRLLRKGMSGPDVLAVQRALRAAGFRTAAATSNYGDGTVLAVKRFQKRHGLDQDGVYGRLTHRKLARRFDAHGLALLLQAQKAIPGDKIARAEAAAMLLYNRRQFVHYTQGPSRMQGVRNRMRPPAYPIWEDCSSACTWFAFVGGWRNPNGYDGWPSYGYTGTLVTHGRYSSGKVRGALGFYGRGWPYSHVVLSVGTGSRVVSHGSEGGPYLCDWNYRSDFRQWRVYV
jgi:peptidoglycan hydrolase-like protein with peptidoglycan-binding domain